MKALPRARDGGETAKARWAFYKRLVALGCVYCAGCRCYMTPEHTCTGLDWIKGPAVPATLGAATCWTPPVAADDEGAAA